MGVSTLAGEEVAPRERPMTKLVLPVLVLAALSSPLAGQPFHLVAGDGAAGDQFGKPYNLPDEDGPAVAMSGDWVALGSGRDEVGGQAERGSVSMFRRSGDLWNESVITVASGEAGDRFGAAVALSGDVLVVGAPRDEVDGSIRRGSAWVFRWDGSSWVEEQQLVIPGPVFSHSQEFGSCVTVLGDVIAVSSDQEGGVGTVRVFRFDGATWIHEQQLVTPSIDPDETFGSALALGQDRLFVGDPVPFVGISGQGAVHVYHWDGALWSQEQLLTPDASAGVAFFGASLSTHGDALAVGAQFAMVNGVDGTGMVSIYRRAGSTWSLEQDVVQASAATFDAFGAAVALSGELLVVGASYATVGSNVWQGSAIVFRRTGGTWVEGETLAAPGGKTSDLFGAGVAGHGQRFVFAVPQDDIGSAPDVGSAWAFDLPGGAFEDAGCAHAGVAGHPLLTGAGDLSSGSGNEVRLTDAAPNALAGLFLALGSTPTPFKGGTLKPVPFFEPTLLLTSGDGAIPLPFVMPAGVPAATEIWAQWAIQDGAATKGVSLSNALVGLTP
jgi:hypothetical protein